MWQVNAWLIDQSDYEVDNISSVPIVPDYCSARLAVRKPQNFKPVTGTPIIWNVYDVVTGQWLQGGNTVVGPDDLVSIDEDILLYKRGERRVRIRIECEPMAKLGAFPQAYTNVEQLTNQPSFFASSSTLKLNLTGESEVEVVVIDLAGKVCTILSPQKMAAGTHDIPINQQSLKLAPGLYFLKAVVNKKEMNERFMVMD